MATPWASPARTMLTEPAVERWHAVRPNVLGWGRMSRAMIASLGDRRPALVKPGLARADSSSSARPRSERGPGCAGDHAPGREGATHEDGIETHLPSSEKTRT